MTLTDFLLTRIADKKHVAGRMVVSVFGDDKDPGLGRLTFRRGREDRVTDAHGCDVTERYAAWATQHQQVADPVGLAECEALERIVKQHVGVHRCEWGELVGGDCGEDRTKVLRILAVPYAGHVDYEQDWEL